MSSLDEVLSVVKAAGKILNLGRGVRLARAAYESRTKKTPPPIIEARYERDGEILESYEREELDAMPLPAAATCAARPSGKPLLVVVPLELATEVVMAAERTKGNMP